jgi:hypothetical protein
MIHYLGLNRFFVTTVGCCLVLAQIGQFWRFLTFFGGYWALFKARSWGEVGRWLPTSYIYKPGLIEAMRGDSK